MRTWGYSQMYTQRSKITCFKEGIMFQKENINNLFDKEYRRDENMRMKINGIKVENEKS